MEFTVEFARLTPRSSSSRSSWTLSTPCAVIVGEDTRFGWKNSGNVDTLRELGASHDFDVIVLADLGDGERWSSTMARGAARGGRRRGRRLSCSAGRPASAARSSTATTAGASSASRPRTSGRSSRVSVPADGVYAGWLVRLDLPEDDSVDRVLPCAVSIGTNPTFDGHERRVEGYVLDRTDLDLYGERICYELVRRLRPTLKYEGIEPLVRQMNLDVAQCREILSTIVPS
jgi:riboflavin kinase/FMN adenylyltransferase